MKTTTIKSLMPLPGNKPAQLLYTLLLALIGAFVFQWVHMPIPWLLGPMFFVLIGSKSIHAVQPYWPPQIRDTGMIVVGYSMGLSFTVGTFQQIGHQLPAMVLLTALLLVCSFVIALLVSYFSGIPFPTVLIGSIPGGLNQMIVFAEEVKGIEMTVVTFLQVSRLMMIIFFVPLLVFSPLFGDQDGGAALSALPVSSASWAGLFPHILVFAVVCPVAAILAKKIKMPTAFLLAPMIATILINLSGYTGPALPSGILNASQLLIGSYVGLLLKPEELRNKTKMIALAVMSGVILIGCSLLLTLLLTKLHPVTLETALLSLSPGGMDQMGIIAHEVGADLTIVIVYQLFRTLFIFIAVPPLLKALFQSLRKREAGQG